MATGTYQTQASASTYRARASTHTGTGTYQTPEFTHTSSWQLGKSISECMLELFHTKLWSDVSFVCTDQNRNNLDDRVPAHKMLLAAGSPVFQQMFYGSCSSTTADIQLDDMKAEDFKLFLTYLYSDSVDLTSADAASSVMQIAHKYQVTSLLKYCSSYLASIINTENACDILQLALFYGEKNLTDTVINYIDDHAEQFIKTDAFWYLVPSSLMFVLKGNTLFAPESKIFHAVIKWAKCKCEMEGVVVSGQAIRRVLGEMFYYLRTPTLSTQDFFKCTFMQGYYSLEEYETLLYTFLLSRLVCIELSVDIARELLLVLAESRKIEIRNYFQIKITESFL